VGLGTTALQLHRQPQHVFGPRCCSFMRDALWAEDVLRDRMMCELLPPSFVLPLPSSLFLLASYHSIMLILSKGMKVKRMSCGRDVQAQLYIYLRHQKQPQQLYDSLSADAYLYFSTRSALFFRRAHQAKPHDTHRFELITGNAGNEPRTSSRTSARTLCLSDPECSFR
jgi:hypothetical protein